MLAHLPLVPLPGRGEQRLQPIHIDDLAAVVRILGDTTTSRARIELVGPQSLSLRGHPLRVAWAAMHLGPPHFLPVDAARARRRMVAGVSTMSPLDSETLSMLEAGTRGDPAAIRFLLGRDPRPVAPVNSAS